MKIITCPSCMRQFEVEAENISGRFRCPDCHIRFAVDADGATTEIDDSKEVFLLFPRNQQLSIWERLFFAAAWIIWIYVLFAFPLLYRFGYVLSYSAMCKDIVWFNYTLV